VCPPILRRHPTQLRCRCTRPSPSAVLAACLSSADALWGFTSAPSREASSKLCITASPLIIFAKYHAGKGKAVRDDLLVLHLQSESAGLVKRSSLPTNGFVALVLRRPVCGDGRRENETTMGQRRPHSGSTARALRCDELVHHAHAGSDFHGVHVGHPDEACMPATAGSTWSLDGAVGSRQAPLSAWRQQQC
jgi:hypothetical protein